MKRTGRLGIVVLLLSIFSSLSGVFPVSAKPFTYVSRIDPVLAATTCSLSLQSLVDAAAPGAVVTVPACMYRETVTINKPLTLDGQPGAEIRGSDVWSSGWKKRGRYWTRGTVPAFAQGNWPCESRSNGRCRWPEQVFFDGRPLEQVASNPQSGQFAIDSSRRVIMADDPRGHMIEVTTREYWITGQSDNVTIQGFTMKHAAPPAQHGALSNDGYDNWTIQNNTLSDAHGAVVSLLAASGLKLLNNDISRGGQLGVHGWQVSDSLVQGNHIHDNNTDAFDAGWEAGGLKISSSQNVTVSDNVVDDNDGSGLWFDMDCTSITIANNRVHHNLTGIMYEISRYGTIVGNRVWENGWGNPAGWGSAGIFLNNADHTEVSDNIVAWNVSGITVLSRNRADSQPVIEDYVHENTIVATDDFIPGNRFGLRWLEDWVGPLYATAANNRGANNQYWYPTDTTKVARFQWKNELTDLDVFNQTPGEENGAYITTALKDQLLSAAEIPLRQEQH